MSQVRILRQTPEIDQRFVLGLGDSVVLSSYRWSGGYEYRYQCLPQPSDLLDAVLIREWETGPVDLEGFVPLSVTFTFCSPGQYTLEVVRQGLRDHYVCEAFRVYVTVR